MRVYDRAVRPPCADDGNPCTDDYCVNGTCRHPPAPGNRPTPEGPVSLTGALDAAGQARVTFTVSMQPGNNYRAGASCLPGALNQPPGGQTMQDVADAINNRSPVAPGDWSDYSVPLTWSPMLTVWRKLHVETDTMVRPTFAQNTFTMNWDEPRQGPAQRATHGSPAA